MDKWKIDIWQFGSIVETYESENIDEVLKWYKENWSLVNEYNGCAFDVFKNDEELTYEQKDEVGFYEY